jgi:hypothetical protein
MLGGAVVKFLDADPSVTFYYPIGLLIGFVVYTVLALFIDPKSDIATALLGPGRVN